MKARKIIRGCFGCGPIVVPFYDALLVFPVVVVLIVAITYLFGGRCAVWQWWTAVLIAMAVGGVRCQRESRCGFLVLFSVLLVVFWILGGILMSNGWDDTLRYHLPAIRLLIEGWNPVWQGRWEMVQSLYGIADTEARSWMILSMPKSVWYFNAAAYFFIRNPHNLLYPIVPILTASVAISVWRNFDTVPRLLRAAIFGFIILVTPSYSCVVVDTVIALSATGLLIAMWRSLKYRTWNWIELICYSFWMCTAKQVSLLHCGVFWTVFWLAAWMVSRKAQLVKFTVMAMALLVLCLVSGVSPYITQWVNFGHPLYPEYTTDEVAYPARHETADFLVRNEDAASMGHVGAYVNAFLSSGIARWYYRKTLGRDSFTPDSITWLQQSGRSEGAPTSALFRTSFALGLIFLFLLGGAAERFVVCAIMAGAIALPTEMIGYVRYVPWSHVFLVFAIPILGFVRITLRRILEASAGIFSFCVLLWSAAVYSTIVDHAYVLKSTFKSGMVERIYYNGHDKTTLGNLKLLMREDPSLAMCEMLGRDDRHEIGSQDNGVKVPWFDYRIGVRPNEVIAPSGRELILQEGVRAKRMCLWPGFMLRTIFVTVPKALASRICEL